MKTALATTVSRRVWLSRLLVAAAVAPVAGLGLAGGVDASKKTKKQIKQRADEYKRACETGGGTATVTQRRGGTTVACKGSEGGDWSCTVSSGQDRCHANLPNTPTTRAGGGAAVPPSGGNEDPADDGSNAGGGAAVPPGGTADPSGGSTGPVLE